MKKQCAYCGEFFETDTPQKKYCKKCTKHIRESRRKPDMVVVRRKCLVCKKPMEIIVRLADLDRTLFLCSDECRQAFYEINSLKERTS